jgi:hypothetical protein
MSWPGLDWVFALQRLSPALDGVMRALSFFGDEIFFSVFVPFLYWCVDAALGLRVLAILVAPTSSTAWSSGPCTTSLLGTRVKILLNPRAACRPATARTLPRSGPRWRAWLAAPGDDRRGAGHRGHLHLAMYLGVLSAGCRGG